MAWKRIKTLDFWLALLLTLWVSIAFVLSLLPLIAWWGGLIGLVLFAYYFYLQKAKKVTLKPWQNRVYGLARWAIIFGIVLYTGCRLYSSFRVSQLASDCEEQKKAIFHPTVK